MTTRNTLKRLAIGSFVLGLSGAFLLSAFGFPAHASARHPTHSESGPNKPDAGPSAAVKDEKERHRGFFLIEDSAEIIGIDKSELMQQVKDGKSIAEIAAAKGVQEADLIDRLVAARKQKIDEAVKSGKWTQEKADRIKEKLPEHIRKLVHNKDWNNWHKDKDRKDSKDHKENKHKSKEHKNKENKKTKETQVDSEALPF